MVTTRTSRFPTLLSMTLRTILRFGFALGYPDCAALVERLKMVRFENAGAREQEMTAHQAMAFIRAALARDDDRGRNMAIGVAAQPPASSGRGTDHEFWGNPGTSLRAP